MDGLHTLTGLAYVETREGLRDACAAQSRTAMPIPRRAFVVSDVGTVVGAVGVVVVLVAAL